MPSYDFKRVADPIHGTIGLSELEAQIMHTQVFQRLRNVKQLGLAHYVYPGADYSRLSHSLGACHVTGRILEALRRNGDNFEISEDDFQLYRVAALLHDIGHYPFSHAMEEALASYYVKLAEATQGSKVSVNTQRKPLNHEKVGKEILNRDGELCKVLSKNGIDTNRLHKVFNHHEDAFFLANIISSDLDADRIDYLLRTARHTGLPYGSVDLDYLLSQMNVDEHNRVCISAKAVRTADHFLLCRYFDYQQVSYHKTVAAFEMVLKDVISALLEAGKIKGSAMDVKEMIDNGKWHRLDDAQVMQRIIELADDRRADNNNRLKAQAILERKPPKLLHKKEYLKAREEGERTGLLFVKRTIQRQIAEWSEEFGVDESLWYLWHKAGIALTNVGSSVPVSSIVERTEEDENRLAQAIYVQEGLSHPTRPIVELNYSLLNPLSNFALYSLRLYVLLPPGKEELLDKIKTRVRDFF